MKAHMFFMEPFVDSCKNDGIPYVSQITNVYWGKKRRKLFSLAETIFVIIKKHLPFLCKKEKLSLSQLQVTLLPKIHFLIISTLK